MVEGITAINGRASRIRGTSNTMTWIHDGELLRYFTIVHLLSVHAKTQQMDPESINPFYSQVPNQVGARTLEEIA